MEEDTRAADTEGTVPFGDWQTWYRISGELDSGAAPLVTAHGGPGCTHDYLLSLADLADRGRPVIHYDQLGNGRSTHLPGRGAEFWTPELFLDELENLLSKLGVAGNYHLLGQSWGGMLTAEHALRHPSGLRSIIIANSPAAMPLWLAAAAELRAQLPADVQEQLDRHEAEGTTDSPEYLHATQVFYERHVCRVVPNPPEVARAFAAIDDDPTVYHSMNGPNEFHVVGTLRDWTIIDRVHAINVPTLLISGRHDEATPATVQPYADGIPDVRWRIFEHSSHMPHVEERAAYLQVVQDFVDEHDRVA